MGIVLNMLLKTAAAKQSINDCMGLIVVLVIDVYVKIP